MLAAAVRQIVQEMIPVLSFFSRFTALSAVKSHYLLTYNQRFVEIIKVSTDSCIFRNLKRMHEVPLKFSHQSSVDAHYTDSHMICLHKRLL